MPEEMFRITHQRIRARRDDAFQQLSAKPRTFKDVEGPENMAGRWQVDSHRCRQRRVEPGEVGRDRIGSATLRPIRQKLRDAAALKFRFERNNGHGLCSQKAAQAPAFGDVEPTESFLNGAMPVCGHPAEKRVEAFRRVQPGGTETGGARLPSTDRIRQCLVVLISVHERRTLGESLVSGNRGRLP